MTVTCDIVEAMEKRRESLLKSCSPVKFDPNG